MIFSRYSVTIRCPITHHPHESCILAAVDMIGSQIQLTCAIRVASFIQLNLRQPSSGCFASRLSRRHRSTGFKLLQSFRFNSIGLNDSIDNWSSLHMRSGPKYLPRGAPVSLTVTGIVWLQWLPQKVVQQNVKVRVPSFLSRRVSWVHF